METIVRDNFARHKDLRAKLKVTSTRPLLNSYNDATVSNLYWGVVEGEGKNHLGRILEGVRYDILNNLDTEKWVHMSHSLIKQVNFIPKITIKVIKAG